MHMAGTTEQSPSSTENEDGGDVVKYFFNTTILEGNFYFESQSKLQNEEGLPRILFTEFEGMQRYMWNMGVEVLIESKALDRFGRVVKNADAVEHWFRDWCGDNTTPIEVLLTEKALDRMVNTFNPQEWIKLFPKCMAQVAISHLWHTIKSGTPRVTFQKKGAKNVDVIIPIGDISSGLKSLNIYRDVNRRHNQMEYTMMNQFDNEVKMVIASNTLKLDDVMDEIAEGKVSGDYSIVIGKANRLERFHKLLLTMIITEKGEKA